uniref:Uncharacterized protein n=1 Tax=Arundo donax TaxID=35708 RepID=A0A0A9BKB6_ARUDO
MKTMLSREEGLYLSPPSKKIWNTGLDRKKQGLGYLQVTDGWIQGITERFWKFWILSGSSRCFLAGLAFLVWFRSAIPSSMASSPAPIASAHGGGTGACGCHPYCLDPQNEAARELLHPSSRPERLHAWSSSLWLVTLLKSRGSCAASFSINSLSPFLPLRGRARAMLSSSLIPVGSSASSTPPSICHHSSPLTQPTAAAARVLVPLCSSCTAQPSAAKPPLLSR